MYQSCHIKLLPAYANLLLYRVFYYIGKKTFASYIEKNFCYIGEKNFCPVFPTKDLLYRVRYFLQKIYRKNTLAARRPPFTGQYNQCRLYWFGVISMTRSRVDTGTPFFSRRAITRSLSSVRKASWTRPPLMMGITATPSSWYTWAKMRLSIRPPVLLRHSSRNLPAIQSLSPLHL
jgi:hypothetical protein